MDWKKGVCLVPGAGPNDIAVLSGSFDIFCSALHFLLLLLKTEEREWEKHLMTHESTTEGLYRRLWPKSEQRFLNISFPDASYISKQRLDPSTGFNFTVILYSSKIHGETLLNLMKVLVQGWVCISLFFISGMYNIYVPTLLLNVYKGCTCSLENTA